MPKGRIKKYEPNEEILFQTLALYGGVTSSRLRLNIATTIRPKNGLTLPEICAVTQAAHTTISTILKDFNLLGVAEKTAGRYKVSAAAEYVLMTLEEFEKKTTEIPMRYIVEASNYPPEIRSEVLRYLSIGPNRDAGEIARQSYYAVSSLLRYTALRIISDSNRIAFQDLRTVMNQKNKNVPASTQSNILTSLRNTDLISANAEGYSITPNGKIVLSSIQDLAKTIGENFVAEKVGLLKRANSPVDITAAYEAMLRSYFNL